VARSTGIVMLARLDSTRKETLTEGHVSWYTLKIFNFFEAYPNFCLGTELQSYCTGLIDAGFSRIPQYNGPVYELPYRGSVQEHLRLLSISERVIEELVKSPSIQGVSAPTLLHPDIHRRNIYVSEEDPSCVTAIID
jgi:hypothetical protein